MDCFDTNVQATPTLNQFSKVSRKADQDDPFTVFFFIIFFKIRNSFVTKMYTTVVFMLSDISSWVVIVCYKVAP